MSMQDIPLDKLSLSPQNVRPKPPTDSGIAELAASIQHHGLQQNLVVIPKNKREKTFAVIAGGRRLAALKLLVEQKNLHPKAPIPCRIEVDKQKASEQSLAENTLRLNMNPADACAAFETLVNKGQAVEDIARNFGVTVRFIKQRLALASLAEPIMQALRSGEITLDTAAAFADCPDQKRQADVFGRAQYNLSNTSWIKRLLSQDAVSSASRIAKFVGEEAFVAAGGNVTPQLFEDDRLYDNAELLDELALKKIDAEIAGKAETLGLSEIVPILEAHMPYHIDGMQPLPSTRREATAAEQADIDALEEQLEALHEQGDVDDLSDDAYQALQDQIDVLEKDLHIQNTALETYDPALKAQAVAYAFVDDTGTVIIGDRYYVPHAIMKTASKAQTASGEGTVPDSPRESAKLKDDLAEHRAMILAAGLAQAPDLAHDLGRFEVIVSLITNVSGPSAFALKARPLDRLSRPDLSGTIAAHSLHASLEALDDHWLHKDTYDGMFAAFQALPEAAKIAWFSFAVAHSVQSVKSYDPGAGHFQAHLFDAMAMTEADWWRPTVENYFGRVKKADCLAIAEEIGGTNLKAQLAGLKKGDIAQALEDVCAGKGHLSPKDRQKALAWMPEVMRFGSPQDVSHHSYGNRLKLRGLDDTGQTEVSDAAEPSVPADEDDLINPREDDETALQEAAA
ncbi:MAG: ParB/RepB/Spo0J family partition protein [Pseudomonadota bacterium]